MFDAATAALLRSAPVVPGLDPDDIPALLTRHYADLVSARLRGIPESGEDSEDPWSLERVADTYEIVASLQLESETRRASSFVAATAQQILARRNLAIEPTYSSLPAIDRDQVDPAIAAAVLFLVAEQYADANEAASLIRTEREGQLYEATILAEHVADLARGQLRAILERGGRWRRRRRYADLEERALAALLEALATGIEILASRFLDAPIPDAASGRFAGHRDAFLRVIGLSTETAEQTAASLGSELLMTYAGPHHLASLLLSACDAVGDAALITIPPPNGADTNIWSKWLRYRAEKFPFVWPNHRQAVEKEFHETGKSSVVVLPTGAGKTTISSLKMAGALACHKKVVFLAPTHALVDQLTEDLREMFPQDLLGSVVSSDFDRLFQIDAQFEEIEVMTPERCLAMLSFVPDAFQDVGLLVFDECHLLSPESGKIRRALDSMLCILGFNHIAPEADLLFMSAMLKNSAEFASWIHDLTGRQTVCVDLLWKPSRQARGVITYNATELKGACRRAVKKQSELDAKAAKKSQSLRVGAARELVAYPWAIWGLQHNWLAEDVAHYVTSKLADQPVQLAGNIRYGSLRITPNANQVAASLAIAAANNGIKSIVFVNTKQDAVTVAKTIANELSGEVSATEAEKERWQALEVEVGGLEHAVLSGPALAVPHNSAMLRLERDLSERMFKRTDGAKAIVATPTLAQGLNLPAHLAILAGDKRADTEKGGREDLEAHEILNAAARAGRAGHLANGLVLLIPEPMISFFDENSIEEDAINKLRSILPEDDRCVVISDPLEVVLDRLMAGDSLDADVRYTINRMAVLRESVESEELTPLFDLHKSFGAFASRAHDAGQAFDEKLDALKLAIAEGVQGDVDSTLAMLASQSGLSVDLLQRLRKRVQADAGKLPVSVSDWITWVIVWLSEDDEARNWLLLDIRGNVLAACGVTKKGSEVTSAVLAQLLPGLHAWVSGQSIVEIEVALGGDPCASAPTKRVCPRARELAGSVIPRGISFIMGLVCHVVEGVDPFDQQENLSRQLVESLSVAVRKGFDTPEKLAFSSDNTRILSRVQLHKAWAEQNEIT